MYTEFQMVGISNKAKTIIVEFNKLLNVNRLSEFIIQVIKKDDADDIPFTIKVDKKLLIIELIDYPEINTKYILRVKNIYSYIDEKITPFRRYISFNSQVLSTVEFITPNMFESINKLNISVKQNIIDKEYDKYILDISTDNIFSNIIHSASYNFGQSFTLDVPDGQLFLRAKIEGGQYSDTLTVIKSVDNKTNDSIDSFADIDLDIEPLLDLSDELKIIDYPIQGDNPTKLIFKCNNKLNDLDYDIYLYDGNQLLTDYFIDIEDNKIIIEYKFESNKKYKIDFEKIYDTSGQQYSEIFYYQTKLSPLYTSIYAVRSLISDINVSDATILYHIFDASKYVQHLSGKSYDENNVPFEIESFVKYRAAHECLLNYLIHSSETEGLSGTVGNVTFNEKESKKDLSDVLKHLKAEEDKWNSEARGYTNEGHAKPTYAVRGKWKSRLGEPYEPPYINNPDRRLTDYGW